MKAAKPVSTFDASALRRERGHVWFYYRALIRSGLLLPLPILLLILSTRDQGQPGSALGLALMSSPTFVFTFRAIGRLRTTHSGLRVLGGRVQTTRYRLGVLPIRRIHAIENISCVLAEISFGFGGHRRASGVRVFDECAKEVFTLGDSRILYGIAPCIGNPQAFVEFLTNAQAWARGDLAGAPAAFTSAA